MPDLAQQIRAKLQPTYTAPWAIKQYRAALAAVLKRHSPETEHSWDYGSNSPHLEALARARPRDRKPLCSACSVGVEHQVPWPCPELREVATALGIEVDRG